jgi:arginine utilization protein RocB
VTSNRRRKQKAQALGLNAAELQLCELLAQVLELLRWNQVLGYSNQYLLHEKLAVSADERSRIMRAAAQAVEQDGRLMDWGRRLIEIQESLQRIERNLRGEAEDDGGGGATGTDEAGRAGSAEA